MKYPFVLLTSAMVLGSSVCVAQAILKPTILKSAQECVARGGKWQLFGFSRTIHFCDVVTVDAHKACTDSSECQGTCVAIVNPRTEQVRGECASRLQDQGCVAYLEQGQLKREPCF